MSRNKNTIWLTLFIISFFLISFSGGVFFYFVDINRDENGFYFSIEESKKPLLKEIALKVKRRIYYEATIHNPEGDTLPDWVDDIIIGKIKETIR